MDYSILPMLPEHWPAVQQIYSQGLATGNATFETELPDWEKWDSGHRKDCRLVAVESTNHQNMLGWAALSPVSSRHVYRGVAEVSVYVGSSARGRGVGTALLQTLIRESESAGIWTLQAGIFPENAASVTLHKSCGFREVGVRQKIGMLKGMWRDVLLLERRSSIAT
jgi:L-amino acid N-acyltransferase YncA